MTSGSERLREAAAVMKGPGASGSRAAALGRVLVVEDGVVNRKVAVELLSRAGCESDVAVDGEEAVTATARTAYDLVLMDCQMPRLDGYEATRAIRARESASGSRRVPIVALTAQAVHDDRERCLAAGMDDYLSKPIRAAALREILDRWLLAPSEPAPAGPRASGANEPDMDAEVLAELRELGGTAGPEVLAEILTTFLREGEQRLAVLRSALDSENWHDLGRAAHALKGASATVGARGLSSSCARLEREVEGPVAPGPRPAEWRALVDEIVAAFARARPHLEALRGA